MKTIRIILLTLACLTVTVFPALAGDFTTTPPDKFGLGPEDVLQIFVWDDETLSPQVVVRPDGKISLPLIGDVDCQGRTVEEIRKEIAERIKRYVPDSPVSVMVNEINSNKVYVLGRVNRPGMYFMAHPMTIIHALALAGGFTPFADQSDIQVMRVINGVQTVWEFDFEDVKSDHGLDKNIWIEANDVIIVP